MKSKTTSVLSPQRILAFLRSRWNPLFNLTPERLTQLENEWDAGQLRGFALAAEKIKETDDVLKAVAMKREAAPAARGWEILTTEDSPRARKHKDALLYFYNNLVATSAVNLNERGGVGRMIRQMMTAVGMQFAQHEVIWKPSRAGVTAELRFVPLHFFENTTGRLRFLETEGAYYGADLEDGGWMTTVGDFLLRPSARAWLFKHEPLRDWLVYCGRNGMPGFLGKTTASPDSPQWMQMEDAVEALAAEFAGVISSGDSIDKVELSTQGQLPYGPLVDRMDRAFSVIWRGGDLSTLAKDDSVGGNAQSEEKQILDASDVTMINEAANWYLDRWVILFATGDETPLAYFSVKPSTRKNIADELTVDRAFFEMGVPLSVQGLGERYNRSAPATEEDSLVKPAGTPGTPGAIFAANAAPVAGAAKPKSRIPDSSAPLVAQAVAETMQVRADWLAPFFQDLEAKARDGSMTDEEFLAALEEAAAALPELLDPSRIEESARPIRDLLETALANQIAVQAEASAP